jgi:hypothetical protein
MNWRSLLWLVRGALAVGAFVLAGRMAWQAMHIPIELGGIVAAPLLLGCAWFVAMFGLACAIPGSVRSLTAGARRRAGVEPPP